MIEVNLATMTAQRTSVPAELVGLDADTLRDLQTALDPVPDHLIGIEYWPEVDETPEYNSGTHQTGDETLTPDDATKTVRVVRAIVPIPAEVMARHQAERWELIKAERDRRKSGGVKVTVDATTGNKWFHSDDASRIQQIGLVMMGANIPAGLQWKTMDGTFVTMTQALANAIFNAAASLDQAAFAKAEEHKAGMEAAEDPLAYDFSTGWPIIYGE